MVKKLKLLFLGALVLAACSKENGGGTGRVSFALNPEGDLAEVTKSQLSDYATPPAVSDFNLSIVDSHSTPVWSGKVSDWDPETKLDLGSYTATATYGSTDQEGFSMPALSGSKDFSITAGETTAVTINPSVANALVKIVCTDAFKNYFKAYSFTLKTGANNEIEFSQGETRAAFIDPFKFQVTGSLTAQNGAVKNFASQEYNSLESATCYTLKMDVSNVGGVQGITINFNDDVQTINLEEELND